MPLTPAQQDLAGDHLPLAYYLAHHHYATLPETVRRMVAREDIFGAAELGLCQAATSYRPGPVPFSRYARHRIAGAILDYLRQQDPYRRSDRKRIKCGELAEARPVSLDCAAALEADDFSDSAHFDAQAIAARFPLLGKVYLEGIPLNLIAAERHLDPSRISQLVHADLARARTNLEKRPCSKSFSRPSVLQD